MYKKLFFLLILIPLMANAETPLISSNEQIPLPTKGFKIVDMGFKNKRMLTASGYRETNSEDQTIRFFLQLKDNAQQQINEYKGTTNVGDTHLKGSLAEVKLSIPFKKLDGVSNNEIIGYAPIGSYDENGWTGIRIFFEKAPMGICSFSFERFIGINADPSQVKYLINNKPSFTTIDGNYNTGFIYRVSWDDDNKTSVDDSKLECVNRNLDKGIIDKMVALGITIDNGKK